MQGGGHRAGLRPQQSPRGTVGPRGQGEPPVLGVVLLPRGAAHGWGAGSLRATVPAEARGRRRCWSARGVSMAAPRLHLVRLRFTHRGPWPGEVSALTVPDFAGALPDLVSGPHHKVEASRGPEGPSPTGVPGDPGPGSPAESGASAAGPAPPVQLSGLWEPQVGVGVSVYLCMCEGVWCPWRGGPPRRGGGICKAQGTGVGEPGLGLSWDRAQGVVLRGSHGRERMHPRSSQAGTSSALPQTLSGLG